MDIATPVISSSLGLANQACRRCYGRKKKCGRELPRCKTCERANSQCSFEEDRDERGLFPVSYVRGLEAKVRELESELQNLSSLHASGKTKDGVQLSSESEQDVSKSDLAGGRQARHTSMGTQGLPHPITPSPQSVRWTEFPNKIKKQGEVESLEAELTLLSLEATAERYLGSSSGVTFARLTQAVLRRLKPDLQPFAFHEPSAEQLPSSADERGESAENLGSYSPSSVDAPSAATIPPLFMPLPSRENAYRITEYYWNHSHTLYPFIRQSLFMESLATMYSNPDDYGLRSSHSWLYTMWMVFAIGSTSLSSVLMTDETESVRYWNAAMSHFDGALNEGNMASLNAILLQVSYSFFNQVGPNTWYLIGMGVRIALGCGLHTNPKTKSAVQLPKHVQEYRSRIFFSLYMMDRLVSITLGRPFGIRDEDIEIELFTAADDANILPDRILPHNKLTLPATSVPLHIVKLRQIAGEIFLEIYSNKNKGIDQAAKDVIVRQLHEKLIDWRRNMPFPLPESTRIPHLSTTWFDLNYHNHVIMLYRPSPLCPTINVEKITILGDAAARSVRHVATMHHQQRFAFNWLNLFSIFTSTLALIYAITAQPEPISIYLQRSDALADLRIAADLLQKFGERFPSALKYRDMVRDVISRLELHIPPTTVHNSTTPDSQSHSGGVNPSDPNQAQLLSWTPSASVDGLTAYPSLVTGNSAYDNLQNQVSTNISSWSPALNGRSNSEIELLPMMDDLPLAVQLSHSQGLYDDFAAQDLVMGFDMSSDMNLDDDIFSYLNTTHIRS